MNNRISQEPGRPMDRGWEALRFYHYGYSTEKGYLQWILRYIRFSDRRHPNWIIVN